MSLHLDESSDEHALSRRHCVHSIGVWYLVLSPFLKARADQRVGDLAVVLKAIQVGGATTLAAIARELNERDMITPRGGRWHASSVANLLRRLEA